MHRKHFICFPWVLLPLIALPQGHDQKTPALETIYHVEPQPLLSQAARLSEALTFLGSSLQAEDIHRINALQSAAFTEETSRQIQDILDPYCLAMVRINPESRVKVDRGPARAILVQGGWKSFLIKVHNEAGITPVLHVESPNALPTLHRSAHNPRMLTENILSPGQVDNRFLEVLMYHNRPLQAQLTGLNLEYAVLQVYCRDAGQREAEIAFNVGQGSQDIGFRNSIHILFTIKKAVHVKFNVRDDDGSPTMASFTITDGIDRISNDSTGDYRLTLAQLNYWVPDKELTGIYPLPSRRVAAYDVYPDFFFQPQVYRSDGEDVILPPGEYTITYTRGPEYIPQTQSLNIPTDVDSFEASFRLKRWIDMAALGWYSGDHHIHAAGCSHYESPEEGVPPEDMWRQVVGEDLNVAAVLTWGPGWYHQKEFFTGNDEDYSSHEHLMRYDVEVSGFPSSHAGHIVLLRLKEDDFPGTTTIEEWPSWTLPVLQWAKSQGGYTGYAHSGWGLAPIEETNELPFNILPKMDGIGANEYIVTVTQDVLDFYSAGNTPAPWELNMWYHTLNCGYRTRLSGETDFPCIFDERVGLARSYFKTDEVLSYESYVTAIQDGRSYVSDGASHIIDFTVDDIEMGTGDSELLLSSPQSVHVRAKGVALLPAEQTRVGAEIASRPLSQQPYWNIERARIGTSREVAVELLVNGVPVDTIHIIADGNWNDLQFNYYLQHSAWIALRIYPSVHTNPVFVLIDQKPILSRESAEWCRKAVDQCWAMKQGKIRQEERADAEAAYEQARRIYDRMIYEASSK